jgi:hypothetical protein
MGDAAIIISTIATGSDINRFVLPPNFNALFSINVKGNAALSIGGLHRDPVRLCSN